MIPIGASAGRLEAAGYVEGKTPLRLDRSRRGVVKLDMPGMPPVPRPPLAEEEVRQLERSVAPDPETVAALLGIDLPVRPRARSVFVLEGPELSEEEWRTCLDLVAAWTFRPYAQIEAAACRYFRGDYVKQSLAAVGSKDASYVSGTVLGVTGGKPVF